MKSPNSVLPSYEYKDGFTMGTREAMERIAQLAIRYMDLNTKDWRYQAPEVFHPAARVWWALTGKNIDLAEKYMTELEEFVKSDQ